MQEWDGVGGGGGGGGGGGAGAALKALLEMPQENTQKKNVFHR